MGTLIIAILCFIAVGTCWVIVISLVKKKEWPIVFGVFTAASLLFFTLMYGYFIFNSIKQKTWTPEYKVKELKREISEKEKRIRKLEAEITFRETEE